MQLEAKQRANSVPIHNFRQKFRSAKLLPETQFTVHNFHHPRFKYPIHAMTRRFLSQTP